MIEEPEERDYANPLEEKLNIVDASKYFIYVEQDLTKKKGEIYDQIAYLLNELKQIDNVMMNGNFYLTKDEVVKKLRLSELGVNDIPKEIPKVRIGVGYVYKAHDVNLFLDSRRR